MYMLIYALVDALDSVFAAESNDLIDPAESDV